MRGGMSFSIFSLRVRRTRRQGAASRDGQKAGQARGVPISRLARWSMAARCAATTSGRPRAVKIRRKRVGDKVFDRQRKMPPIDSGRWLLATCVWWVTAAWLHPGFSNVTAASLEHSTEMGVVLEGRAAASVSGRSLMPFLLQQPRNLGSLWP